jgi:hypothetical protein
MRKETDTMENFESAFACNMLALNPSLRAEHRENTENLMAQCKSIREIEDGYSFEFLENEEVLSITIRFIMLEKQCCPFLGFQLELKAGQKVFWLRLTGPENIKPLLWQHLIIPTGFGE